VWVIDPSAETPILQGLLHFLKQGSGGQLRGQHYRVVASSGQHVVPLAQASMRRFVRWHLAQRPRPFDLPDPEAPAQLPARQQRAAGPLICALARHNAEWERRLGYRPDRSNSG